MSYTAPYMSNETFQTVVMRVDAHHATNARVLHPASGAGDSTSTTGQGAIMEGHEFPWVHVSSAPPSSAGVSRPHDLQAAADSNSDSGSDAGGDRHEPSTRRSTAPTDASDGIFSTVLLAPHAGLLGSLLAWHTATVGNQTVPGAAMMPSCGIDAKLLSFAQGAQAQS